MTNGSPDPKQRSWTQVGGFMYHFARVEQKINQAVIKLTELDAKSAPVVELIDFAKKVDLVQKSAYAANNREREGQRVRERRVQQSLHNEPVPEDRRTRVFRAYR